MARTYTKLVSHITFSTKDRAPLIVADLQPRLHTFIGGIVRELGGTALIVGGVADHVHILAMFPPRVALSEALREIKAGSSRWMKQQLGTRGGFAWQAGFAAFSVSQSRVPETTQYIANQAEHHRNKTFKEELLEFLQGYEVDYDEQYLWE
jgi:putative transposase